MKWLAPFISWLIGPTVENGALTQLYLAVAPLKENHNIPSGEYWMPVATLGKAHGKYGQSEDVSEKCWELSVELCKKAVGQFPEIKGKL